MLYDTLDRNEVIAELKGRGADWRRFFKEGDSHHYYTIRQARVTPNFYLSIGQILGWPETPNPRHPQ